MRFAAAGLAVLLAVAGCGEVTKGADGGGGVDGTIEVTLDGSGAGREVSEPAGIDCPGTCSAAFAGGTEVVLSASKDDGSAFAGFTGECTGLDPACTIQVDGDRAVTARFALSGEKRFALQLDMFVSDIAVHPSGDLVVAGGDLTTGDLALARLGSADGEPTWQFVFPGVQSPKVAITPTGDIALVGMYFGAPMLGGRTLPDAADSLNLFISEICSDSGAVAWVSAFGGASQDDAREVSVTPDGTIYVGGPYWSPSVAIGDDTLTNADQEIPYTSDAWVGSFNDLGEPNWATAFGVLDGENVAGVAHDAQGNGLEVGSFGGGVSFGEFFFTAADYDGFVVKLRESDGEVLWARQFGAAGLDFTEAVAVDPDGNTVVAGSYSQQQNWGGANHTPVGGMDIFLARYSSGGAHDWSGSLGGGGTEHATALAVDGEGSMILVGYFDGDMDLGGGELANAGDEDVFLVKLDAGGAHAWSYRFGGGMADYGQGVAVDSHGIVYALGTFRGTADVAGETFEAEDVASFLVSYWP